MKRMASAINKKTLEYLAGLSRIKLEEKEEEKLLKDIGSILDYFEELKSLDTSGVEPTRPPSTSSIAKSGEVNGGTLLRNAFREDGERENTNRGEGIDAFPSPEKGFLKIPPVFE